MSQQHEYFVPNGMEDEKPWLKDRHHELLGRSLPFFNTPDFPDDRIIPCYQLNKVLPTGFRAYTRVDNEQVSAWGETHEHARWELNKRIESRVQ